MAQELRNLQSFCCSRVSVEDTLLAVMMIKDRIDEEDVDNVVMAIQISSLRGNGV